MLFPERVRTVSMLCLSIFGCTGNILTLFVVNQRFFRKTPSAAFISGLCIADCLVLFLQSLQIVAKLHAKITTYDCIVFFLMDVFRLFSVWLVCLINIERCSLVFNPCHLPRLTSRIKSRLLVLVIFLVSLIIFSHYIPHMHIAYISNQNETISNRSLCAFKSNFNQLTWEYIRSSLTYWTTIPLCIICNLIIIVRLYQASRIERYSQIRIPNKYDLSNKQRQLTAMLLAASICFVLTAAPPTIHSIYILISKQRSYRHYVIHIFMNILLHFHHASNFLIFILTCTRFRTELSQLCHISLYCQIHNHWHKRSIPQTEPILLYSTKPQKTVIKLLIPKSKTQQRNTQPLCHNGIVALGNADNNKNVRPYRNSIPPYWK